MLVNSSLTLKTSRRLVWNIFIYLAYFNINSPYVSLYILLNKKDDICLKNRKKVTGTIVSRLMDYVLLNLLKFDIFYDRYMYSRLIQKSTRLSYQGICPF
jgi:hypothetical protein